MVKIPEGKMSPSGWRSVSTILNEGVGMRRPCALCKYLNVKKKSFRSLSSLFSRRSSADSVRQDEPYRRNGIPLGFL